MTGYTEGKWTVDEYDRTSVKVFCDDGGEVTIANCYGPATRGPQIFGPVLIEANANALLIAAAKDMRAALEAILPHVSDEIEQRKMGGDETHWADLAAVEKQIIAALKLTEGTDS